MKGRRTRIVQVVAGLAACGLVGLAGYLLPSQTSIAATRMQDPGQKKGDAPEPQSAPPLPNEGPPKIPAPSDEIPTMAKGTLPESEPAAQPSAFVPDPEKDADDFVARTRKEAADRVVALDKEAERLRTRLAKVEAASAKLKAAFGAIGEPVLAPAGPDSRPGERQPPPREDVREDLHPADVKKDGSVNSPPGRDDPLTRTRPQS